MCSAISFVAADQTGLGNPSGTTHTHESCTLSFVLPLLRAASGAGGETFIRFDTEPMVG